MYRRIPPPPPRKRSPVIRIKDYNSDADERCKNPITQTRRTGHKTRVTVSSAQDGYQRTGATYVPITRSRSRREPYSTRIHRPKYESYDYRRSRSRSSSRDVRRRRTRSSSSSDGLFAAPLPRRSRGDSEEGNDFSDSEGISTLEFEFDLTDSIKLDSSSYTSAASLEPSSTSKQRAGHVPVAGSTTDLHLAGSRWLGSTFDNWDLSAELTSGPATANPQSFMNWYHLERHMPTFDEFIAVARRVLQSIPERNLRRVEEMLRKIQRENEKQRQYGRDMVPICVSDCEYQTDGTNDKQDFSACFLTCPYFSLEKLDTERPRSFNPNAPYHPARPLLQTYTRTVNNKRELSQAITTRTSTPKGHSLPVSSVWCLVVNEEIMITCSRMGLEELRKDFTSTPAQPYSASAKTVRIKAGNTRSWSFPVDEVRSWPSLLAMFADDFSTIGDHDAIATFTHHGRIVNGKLWPQIFARTIRFPVELVLQEAKNDEESGLRSKMQVVRDAFKPHPRASEPPVPAPVGDMQTDGARGATAVPSDEVVNQLRSIPALKIFQRDSLASSKPLSRLADALHQSLLIQSQQALQAYSSCPEATMKDVQAAMLQGVVSSDIKTNDKTRPIANSKFERIVLLAEYVFAFFWPIDCDHMMVKRFWGILNTLLKTADARTSGGRPTRRNAEMAAEFYDVLYHRVFAVISAITSSFDGSDTPLLTSFPNQFYEAWLHILSAFVLLSEARMEDSGRHSWRPAVEQLRIAGSKLEAGEEELVNRLRKTEVEEFETCSSRGIIALMLNRLSRDMIREIPDVAQTYSDYCQQLDARVLENPLTRTHQASIRDLQQELEAVLSTLSCQLDVVNVFERGIQAQDDDKRIPYLPPLLDSRQDAVLETCKNTLTARIDQFKALQARVTELGEWHLGEIDNNKDRQEAAIMVFTIVTIIFLPLSFVSSVLGMNTSDIRDMRYSQWLYWVVAVPLTIIVIAGSLYWAGAWDNWQGWSSKSNNAGYQTLTEEQPIRAAAMRRGYVDEQEVEKPRRRTTYPARDAARHYV